MEPAWRPENIYARVYNLPSFTLDDFLAIWAPGDLLGKTQDIDMAFTRSIEVIRICIACLDPSIIPESFDMKIRDDLFNLRFKVEGAQPVAKTDVVMGEAKGHDGDDARDELGKPQNDSEGRDPKRTKGNGDT